MDDKSIVVPAEAGYKALERDTDGLGDRLPVLAWKVYASGHVFPVTTVGEQVCDGIEFPNGLVFCRTALEFFASIDGWLRHWAAIQAA